MDNTFSSRQSLLDRLKPSSRNKIINKKFNLNNSTLKSLDLHFELKESIVFNKDNVDIYLLSVYIDEINELNCNCYLILR